MVRECGTDNVHRRWLQRFFRPRIHVSIKPVIVHLSQKLRCERETGTRANNRINAAAGTKRCRADSILLINPLLDLRRRKRLTAVKASAQLARQNLLPVIAGTIVR